MARRSFLLHTLLSLQQEVAISGLFLVQVCSPCGDRMRRVRAVQSRQ